MSIKQTKIALKEKSTVNGCKGAFTRPQCRFLPVHIDTKNRYKKHFLTIKQYLSSISPLTVKKSCLNFISL